MSAGDRVNLVVDQTPKDYHCTCGCCTQVIGELRPEDGSYYSRLERNQYYDSSERGKGGHIAKTPLHIARWAVQRYTEPGDWVIDPTVGSGTTLVEAITQGRNAAGMEIQYGDILEANISRNLNDTVQAVIRIGDAREIAKFFGEAEIPPSSLVVNNPPYSGDENPRFVGRKKKKERSFLYDDGLPNLAFLRENADYWGAIRTIYEQCIDHLLPGGHFVTGIKDMMRHKRPFLLHRDFCDLLSDLDLTFVGTAFLRHHPGTLHLNTYEKRYGVAPPRYQTISVFRKDKP